MYDIRNLNIWKAEKTTEAAYNRAADVDIADLSLSVRSFNCLKRAGCSTVREIEEILEEDEHGLRKIRNLGAQSEAEILRKIRELHDGRKIGELRGDRKIG